jgi:hypothetical protein
MEEAMSQIMKKPKTITKELPFRVLPIFVVYNWIMSAFDWKCIWIAILLDIILNIWLRSKKKESS